MASLLVTLVQPWLVAGKARLSKLTASLELMCSRARWKSQFLFESASWRPENYNPGSIREDFRISVPAPLRHSSVTVLYFVYTDVPLLPYWVTHFLNCISGLFSMLMGQSVPDPNLEETTSLKCKQSQILRWVTIETCKSNFTPQSDLHLFFKPGRICLTISRKNYLENESTYLTVPLTFFLFQNKNPEKWLKIVLLTQSYPLWWIRKMFFFFFFFFKQSAGAYL